MSRSVDQLAQFPLSSIAAHAVPLVTTRCELRWMFTTIPTYVISNWRYQLPLSML